MSDSLRSKVIRLAHQNPALRPHLLPILKTAAWPFDVQKFLSNEIKKVPGVRVKNNPDNLVVSVGRLNPEVKDVTLKDLNKGTDAQIWMTLKNGMRGWGWNGFRNPPSFSDEQTPLRLRITFDGKRDPEVELREFLKYDFFPSIEKAGKVFVPETRELITLTEAAARSKALAEKARNEAKAKALAEKARNEAKAKPASLPNITKPANYWTRELTRDYLNMEEVLRASGDANGLRILDSFGSLASRPGVFESMSLERLVRYIDDLETRVKDNPSGPHAILSLDESLKDMSKRVRRREIPGSDSDEDFYDREPLDEDEEDRDDDY